ncbi:isocitrate lyase/PEP mutase family protein [Ascidiimonas sp. W6]|uniref:isocitrate lyase/PEP mutase family protein n=1 Tax=Ascidiimonas meishanensis TaxID=3128903 RepID=UPI0030EC11C2
MQFKELHLQSTPLLLANVWDVPSAQAAKKLNYGAIGTSSAAIAALLGYKDGEEIPFSELAFMVKRIAANTKLPLSVDIEAGYSSEPHQIVNHIKELVDLGVQGINIEDSLVGKERSLQNASAFSKTLETIANELQKDNTEVFLNVRTDTFLLELENALSETLRRSKLYANAGASGIFVPCITRENDISAVVKNTALPVNVMCMPVLPHFDTLTQLGVKRISMGNFVFSELYIHFENVMQSIRHQNSFKSLF